MPVAPMFIEDKPGGLPCIGGKAMGPRECSEGERGERMKDKSLGYTGDAPA